MLEPGVSHDSDEVWLILPEVKGPSLLGKGVGTETTKWKSTKVPGVRLEAACTLYMLSLNVGI